MAVTFVLMVPIVLAYVLLWGLVAHGILKIGIGRTETIRRTFQALCYGAGAYVTAVTPCLGGYVGPVWWIVGAILMVREGHKVSGLRATIAVLAFPVGSVLLFVALYVLLIAVMVASASGAATAAGQAAMAGQSTRVLLDGVLDHAAAHDGDGPGHALVLLDTTSVTEWNFVDTTTRTEVTDVPVAGAGSLLDFAVVPPDEKRELAEDAGAALPDDVVAHRLGDFVFTYHGMDLANAPAGLWVVVMAPDPAVNRAVGPIVVGKADGSVQPVPAGRVERGVFTTAVVDREPRDSLDTLSNRSREVFYFSEIRDAPGETITHRWEWGGKLMAEVSFDVGGPRWRVHSSKRLDPNWVGEWTVTVVDSAGRVLSSGSFMYTDAGAEALPATELSEGVPAAGALTPPAAPEP